MKEIPEIVVGSLRNMSRSIPCPILGLRTYPWVILRTFVVCLSDSMHFHLEKHNKTHTKKRMFFEKLQKMKNQYNVMNVFGSYRNMYTSVNGPILGLVTYTRVIVWHVMSLLFDFMDVHLKNVCFCIFSKNMRFLVCVLLCFST